MFLAPQERLLELADGTYGNTSHRLLCIASTTPSCLLRARVVSPGPVLAGLSCAAPPPARRNGQPRNSCRPQVMSSTGWPRGLAICAPFALVVERFHPSALVGRVLLGVRGAPDVAPSDICMSTLTPIFLSRRRHLRH